MNKTSLGRLAACAALGLVLVTVPNGARATPGRSSPQEPDGLSAAHPPAAGPVGATHPRQQPDFGPALMLPLALLHVSPADPPPAASTPTTEPTATAGAPPATPAPEPAGHGAGDDCTACHASFSVAGTVFEDPSAARVAPGVPVSLTRPDGALIVLDSTDRHGNLAARLVPDGTYLTTVGAITSRTWHELPRQRSCNTCHVPGGNRSAERTVTLSAYHTRIPEDNLCAHCHHFPATRQYSDLATRGVLHAAAAPPVEPGSQVKILGRTFSFDPADYEIESVRDDVFAPGYFSMFDAILAVAQQAGIAIEYAFDASRQTHFISKINGVPGDYWYRFSYDTGGANQRELANRRANRWDEALWRPGVWIQVVEGEDLERLKAEYLEEIERERAYGHLVPKVTFSINPSPYQGNPPGSGRVSIRRTFRDLLVTPHSMRAAGFPSPHSKPFRPGVVTSLDIPLSLRDRGDLDVVTNVFYSHFAENFIDSYYVVELGFPGVGSAHASGRQGFVYTTENGSRTDMPNGADVKMHITADIAVLHAPDFSYWRWVELGEPDYAAGRSPERGSDMVAEDYEALARGFNLHPPRAGSSNGLVRVRFNILEPGRVEIVVLDEGGEEVATLFDRNAENIGLYQVTWDPGARAPGMYYVRMRYGRDSQVRAVRIREDP